MTQKSSVAAFLLCSLHKQNGWAKRSENNMKNIIEILIAYWHVDLRCGTWNKTRKIRFSVQVNFQLCFPKLNKSFNILLCCTYIPSSNTASLLLLHLQYYLICESMIFKMSVKSKFVLWKPRFYNLLTEKMDKKIHVFEVLIFFEKVLLLFPRNFFQTPSLDDTFLGNFT